MSATLTPDPIMKPPLFERADYLQTSLYDGVLRTLEDHRVLALPEELLQGLHRALAREIGRAWSVVAYRCGKKWGARSMERWRAQWRDHQGVDPLEAHFVVFEAWLERLFAHQGWGALSLDFSRERDGLMLVEMGESVLVRVLEDFEDDERTCALFAGIFAALFTELVGRELESLELTCAHAGEAERCRFAVGTPARIERARRLRVRQAPTEELWEALMEPDEESA